MAYISDIDKRIMQSLFNSGQMTIDEIAEEFKCKINLVKQFLAEDVKPKCCDRVVCQLDRGREVILDLPCYGTLSYNDVTAMIDSIFWHYFPNESQEVEDID